MAEIIVRDQPFFVVDPTEDFYTEDKHGARYQRNGVSLATTGHFIYTCQENTNGLPYGPDSDKIWDKWDELCGYKWSELTLTNPKHFLAGETIWVSVGGIYIQVRYWDLFSPGARVSTFSTFRIVRFESRSGALAFVLGANAGVVFTPIALGESVRGQ